MQASTDLSLLSMDLIKKAAYLAAFFLLNYRLSRLRKKPSLLQMMEMTSAGLSQRLLH